MRKGGYFAIRKDESCDRTICNRKPVNAAEVQLGLCAHLMAHGTLLLELDLRDDETAVVDLDDLPDFYHGFKTSLAKAFTNAIGPSMPPEGMAGSRALEELRARAGPLPSRASRSSRPPRRTPK